MGNMQVKQAQAGEKLGEDLKSSGREALDSVRTIRNVAAGVAAAGATAMAAEALGVVTLPAAIPTGLVTLVSGSLALATHLIVEVGEGVENLISNSDQRKQLEAAGQ